MDKIDQVSQNGRVGRRDRMKQVYAAGVQTVFHFLKGGCGIGLVVAVIIAVGKSPEHGMVTHMAGKSQVSGTGSTLRRSVEERRKAVAELTFELAVERIKFLHELRIGESRHDLMVFGVVSDEVSLVEHPLHYGKRALLVDVPARHKEYRLNVFGLQSIEDLFGIAVFISAVKRKVAYLLIGILAVDAAVLLKIIERRRISVPGIRNVTGRVSFDRAGIPVKASFAAVFKMIP